VAADSPPHPGDKHCCSSHPRDERRRHRSSPSKRILSPREETT
jgi:hypothetical protein